MSADLEPGAICRWRKFGSGVTVTVLGAAKHPQTECSMVKVSDSRGSEYLTYEHNLELI